MLFNSPWVILPRITLHSSNVGIRGIIELILSFLLIKLYLGLGSSRIIWMLLKQIFGESERLLSIFLPKNHKQLIFRWTVYILIHPVLLEATQSYLSLNRLLIHILIWKRYSFISDSEISIHTHLPLKKLFIHMSWRGLSDLPSWKGYSYLPQKGLLLHILSRKKGYSF